MSAVTNNTNRQERFCFICSSRYKKKEGKSCRKVVELSCGHSFHRSCLHQLRWSSIIYQIQNSTSYEEASNLSRSRISQRVCPSCMEPFGHFIFGRLNFDTEKSFPMHLVTLKKDYEYDDMVMQAINFFEKMFPPSSAEGSPAEDNTGAGGHDNEKSIQATLLFKDLSEAISSRIRTSESFVLPRLSSVEENLSTTLAGIVLSSKTFAPIRSIGEEAKRWENVQSLEEYPTALKERGVMVEVPDLGACRVSVNYLDKAVRHVRQIRRKSQVCFGLLMNCSQKPRPSIQINYPLSFDP